LGILKSSRAGLDDFARNLIDVGKGYKTNDVCRIERVPNGKQGLTRADWKGISSTHQQ